MPPFVERRMTQYVQPREQPRSASIKNMFESSVFGVRIALVAGKHASSQVPGRGSSSPCTAGTKTCGSFASAAIASERVRAFVPLARDAGEAGGVVERLVAGELDLVRDAHGEDAELPELAQGFVGDGAFDVRARPIAVVGQKRAFAREARHALNRAVDALVTERAHADAVR
jgi:hypothetical protein